MNASTPCLGFRAVCGAVELTAAYEAGPAGPVRLLLIEQFSGSAPRLWRNVLVSRGAAVKAAEDLCRDAHAYLSRFPFPTRPSEDLDLDDFVEHLRIKLANELH
jgi:hypothetical protein